ncbi:MAG: hypothetical protein FJW37_02075 [Acidobacteria bacterium]|nr:hypothetical protein [Acidobacteriota bacterium]
MWNFLARLTLTCSHERTSFPLTPRRGAARRQTYVCCLDCGKEFQYDWANMRIGEPVSPRAGAGRTLATIPVETWK